MPDVLTPLQRKKCMASIKNKNTKPELLVRKAVHRMGFRFRLHRNDLPGKPDIVLPCHKKIIFVHGCFWHMHDCKYGRVSPKTNKKFWSDKRNKNVDRDNRNLLQLKEDGWEVLVLWECWTKNARDLERELEKFLT